MNKLPEPIHCVNSCDAIPLLNKKVLCANHKEGLGYYGILRAICSKTGKFIVETHISKKLCKFEWIVEDK